MKTDNLHFNWAKTLTYNKIWNFCIGERESGKSVSSWLHIWKAYHYEKRPSIVLRRRQVDIIPAYIDDTETLLNKFLDKKVQLLYLKGDLKNGVVDIKLGSADIDYTTAQVKKLPVFIRIVALSIPMGRLKSFVLENVKYFFFDEFIINMRAGERYLKSDEHFLIQELYTTYNREAKTPIRILAAGNPYSVYTPIFSALGVETMKLKPGAFIVGPNYIVNCFQVPEELKKIILEKNPMYQFDDAYKRYAFSGEAVNDANIKIYKSEPKGYKLKMVFKMGSEYISIHKGPRNTEKNFTFWACKHKSDWLAKVSKNRKIICFNFRDMQENGTIKFNKDQLLDFYDIKYAMEQGVIAYNCVDAQYMLEELYG